MVCGVNEEVLDNPASINGAPYDSWMIRVKDVSDKAELMDAAAYEAYLKTLA